ncbi:rRNA-processing protein las1 [Rhodotorula toruloides]
MAMVRFVNSLVDPLQTTYFARSIASLAQQIQLPLWFVELRHQATHEDLPSLGVLRDAARQALDWLCTNYWSPALSSSTSLPPLDLSPLRALLLTTYKSLSKLTLRDASLVGRTRGEMRACLGEVERKRPTPRSPTLSPDLLALWTPLITHLDSLPSSSSGSTFSDVLIKRGIDILCASEAEGGEGKERDKSYLAALGLIDSLLASRLQSPSPSLAEDPALKDLIDRTTPLLALARQVAQTSSSSFGPKIDSAEEATSLIDSLLARSAELSSHLSPPSPSITPSTAHSAAQEAKDEKGEGGREGWPRKVEGWKKRPIGFLPAGGFGGLDLKPLLAVQ